MVRSTVHGLTETSPIIPCGSSSWYSPLNRQGNRGTETLRNLAEPLLIKIGLQLIGINENKKKKVKKKRQRESTPRVLGPDHCASCLGGRVMRQSAGLLEQRWGGLDNRRVLSHKSGGWKSKIKMEQVLASHHLPVSSRGLPSVCPPPWRLFVPQSLFLIKDTSQIG